MLHFRIAAFRGRDPDNPSDRKHPSNGRFCQRMEINGGYNQHPHTRPLSNDSSIV